ncbi:FxsB family cyclophane-forming radical SAM/SPASM peptide maturase [Actinoplanes sp. NPDC024001]|uniref:FxsB family cyclophane-forming radical SAM/SPASM peptide maturase n=1 Tax=Actinoplanes sp. NPDC024001 TaxID=3154598 RepID=UPI0034073019
MTSDTVRAAQRAAAPWPYATLDVAALRAAGWQPTALREVVLKVHQRCNLACDYCYVYELADQSWKTRPAAMPDQVWRLALDRLAEHARRHELRSVRVVLHGGEPLLFGRERLAELAAAVHTTLPDTCRADIVMQTNGVRLDLPTIDMLHRHRIRVGVSVDGVQADHDRHRRTRSGRGSFAAVAAALELLGRPENRRVYGGILCTVAPGTDPIACYEQLLKFEPPAIDFLLPHANWDQPPARPGGNETAYADWLIAVFDHWYTADPAPDVQIRLFEDVMRLVFGAGSSSEQVGLSPSGMLVVESDGSYEQVDALKSAYEGACATGLDVWHDDFDAVLADPGMIARQIGVRALSPTCLRCPLHQVCGAGHYAHRYRRGEGFHNPSVYCADLAKLINHVHTRLAADVRRLVS